MDPENTSIRFRASKRKAMRARDTTPSPDSDKGVIRARNKSRRVRGVEMSSASGGAAAQQQQRSADQGKAMTERFTHQTGLISDLDDRHMNEYIESRLSASAQPPVLHAARPAPPRLADGESPTKLGKLFEVDVSHVEHKPQQARATRGQKRPGSDDLKLGHFVEQFLNENKRLSSSSSSSLLSLTASSPSL
ncbi:hypothetical protein CDD82_7857 [Ophiocordyceps australis]|uniref:Uncharacterized protein n=1 Tax=Ophiocordyceps australis TaxID=1399860 RepID=A0A2C5XTQ5_9HYPO|nr:hypothetical protein CDD82_7857 [Ophiocordyceps australis]